eukprot:9572616-Karenia_brevis.AAC.1
MRRIWRQGHPQVSSKKFKSDEDGSGVADADEDDLLFTVDGDVIELSWLICSTICLSRLSSSSMA